MSTSSILLDHILSYNLHCLFSLFTHLQATFMIGGFSTFLKNNYLNTVIFTQMYQDSVDIFVNCLYVVCRLLNDSLCRRLLKIWCYSLLKTFLRLSAFTVFKKSVSHYLRYLNSFLTTLLLS